MEHRLDWIDGVLWSRAHGGFENLGVSSEPDACRKLLEFGLAKPEDRFCTYRGDMRCLTGGVGWAAKREVTVSGEGTPIFRKLRSVRGSRGGKREEA